MILRAANSKVQKLAVAMALFWGAMALDLRADPADKQATPETVALWRYLKGLSDGPSPRVLFGQHLALAYGVGWQNEEGRSDFQSAIGKPPACTEWEFGGIEESKDDTSLIRGETIGWVREHVRKAYAQGTVQSFSWHCKNLVTGKSYYMKLGPSAWGVSQVTPQGSATDPREVKKLTEALDKIADFFLSLKDDAGRPIPMVFRPWHEQNGEWFWWGRGQRSADKARDVQDFVALWKFTVHYLREVRGVHNLLYAFSPDVGDWKTDKVSVWEEYPGDDTIDILGLDAYWGYQAKGKGETKILNESEKGRKAMQCLDEVIGRARQHQKIAVFSEVGGKSSGSLPDNTVNPEAAKGWWMKLLKLLKEDPNRFHIAYLMTWTNQRGKPGEDLHKVERYMPVASLGDDVADVRSFAADPHIMLLEESKVRWRQMIKASAKTR